MESSSEVTRRSGVGDAFGTDRVEKELVVTSDLDILQAGSATQSVVGQVENMIGFVIRHVLLEPMQCPVDPLRKSDHLNEGMNRRHAPVGGAACLPSQLVMRVGALDHRFAAIIST